MGIDKGFDLFPPLTESEVDKGKWAAFLDEVKEKYKNDNNVIVGEMGTIVVTQGEYPFLPKDAHRFRRFSAKISGSHAGHVEKYLYEVEDIANRHFWARIHPWNELIDDATENMRYNWTEVYEARLPNESTLAIRSVKAG